MSKSVLIMELQYSFVYMTVLQLFIRQKSPSKVTTGKSWCSVMRNKILCGKNNFLTICNERSNKQKNGKFYSPKQNVHSWFFTIIQLYVRTGKCIRENKKIVLLVFKQHRISIKIIHTSFYFYFWIFLHTFWFSLLIGETPRTNIGNWKLSESWKKAFALNLV